MAAGGDKTIGRFSLRTDVVVDAARSADGPPVLGWGYGTPAIEAGNNTGHLV